MIAVTFTHNNSTYLTKWEKYYGQYMDLEIINVDEHIRHDWGATVKNLNNTQHLLDEHKIILYADVDEFIVPNPLKYKDLGEYLEGVEENKRATGFNIIEREGDLKLDLSKPVLSQRKYWQRDPIYDKTVIITKPTRFYNNHHSENEPKPDSDLVLMHLRDADIQSAIDRLKSLGRSFNNQDLEERIRQSNLIPTPWNEILCI